MTKSLGLIRRGDGRQTVVHAGISDPVAPVNDGVPVHPDPNRSPQRESWRENLDRRNPGQRPPNRKTPPKPSSDHRIDEYA